MQSDMWDHTLDEFYMPSLDSELLPPPGAAGTQSRCAELCGGLAVIYQDGQEETCVCENTEVALELRSPIGPETTSESAPEFPNLANNADSTLPSSPQAIPTSNGDLPRPSDCSKGPEGVLRCETVFSATPEPTASESAGLLVTSLVPTTLPSTTNVAAPVTTPYQTTTPIADASTDKSNSGLSQGAKIGIGVGVGVGVLLIALLVGLCLWRRKHARRAAGGRYIPQRSEPSVIEATQMTQTPPLQQPREFAAVEEHVDSPVAYDMSGQYQPYEPPPQPEVFHTPVSALTPTKQRFSAIRQQSESALILTVPGPDATPQSSVQSSRASSPERSVEPVSPVSPVSALSPSSSRPPSPQSHSRAGI